MSDTASECMICLDALTEDSYYRFECSHRLHKNCFETYFKYNYDPEQNTLLCPVCKQNIEVHMEIQPQSHPNTLKIVANGVFLVAWVAMMLNVIYYVNALT